MRNPNRIQSHRGRSYGFAGLLAGLTLLFVLPAVSADDIRAPGVTVQVSTRLAFVEGPAYAADGSVYFTDIFNNRIMRLAANSEMTLFGRVAQVYRQPAGLANGLAAARLIGERASDGSATNDR